LPRIPHADGILVTTRPRVGDVRGVSELLERGAGRFLVSQIDRQKPQRLGRWTAWACGVLLEGEIAFSAEGEAAVVKRSLLGGWTPIEAWASIMSFRWKDSGDDDRQGPGRNAERNFHRENRSSEHDRPGRAALQERRRAARQALL
jgi:hypothetical protein